MVHNAEYEREGRWRGYQKPLAPAKDVRLKREIANAETREHDWKAEASGLAWMICNIAALYRQAKEHAGGDSELLASAIGAAERYVDGSLLTRWQEAHSDGEADA